MNDRPTYRKWIGVVLGFLFSGSAHFLSGDTAAGLSWYFSIAGASVLSAIVVAIPGMATFAIGVALWLLAVVLWIFMLKQSYRPVPRIGLLGWIAVIAINSGLTCSWAGAIRAIVHPFRMSASSMSPTIVAGDCVMAEMVSIKLSAPVRGDVIVFRTDGIGSLLPRVYWIKRVAGVPGDRIRVDPPNLIVNDQVVVAPPIFKRISSPPSAGYQLASPGTPGGALLSKSTDEITLGKDEFFVIGDNTRNSRDSRYWGPLPRKNIVARATRIYWPLSRIGQSLGRE